MTGALACGFFGEPAMNSYSKCLEKTHYVRILVRMSMEALEGCLDNGSVYLMGVRRHVGLICDRYFRVWVGLVLGCIFD